VKTIALTHVPNSRTYLLNVHCVVMHTRQCTVHKNLQRLRKKHQPSINSRVIKENSDTPQIQSNSKPLPGEAHLNNVPASLKNEPKDTQHLLYSQALNDNKSNKSKLYHTNDPPSNSILTSQLTTFISEFKTLISPLITLLNPLITLLISLINKLNSNNGN